MKKINNEAEFNEVIGSNGLVVCKIGAQWCAPCRLIEGTIGELEKDYGDSVVFVEIDADDADEDFISSLNIRNIPVVQYYKNGNLEKKTVGLVTKGEIINQITELL